VTPAQDFFSPPTWSWFTRNFQAPTRVQEMGWPVVARQSHALMCAPTGSGKTLAAFLWCIDRLAQEPLAPERERCRVLYISPLKALAVDIERSLRAPLRGVSLEAERLGRSIPDLQVLIRTGDTPAQERRQMERHPPDILVTTPESLYLILTSAAREILRPVRWVIVDEIHALAATKRGAHLALSMERLCGLTEHEPQRIGLSATQKPLDEVGRFLGGAGREVAIVDAGEPKRLELRVEVPVEDMAKWPAIQPRLLELILQHRSTIVFVNSRRLAERLALQLNELHEAGAAGNGVTPGAPLARAHHGSIAREQRTEIEDALKVGRLRALVATSSLELGIDMGAVDLVIQVEAPQSVVSGIQRIGRAGHNVGDASTGVIFPKHRGDLLECAVAVERMVRGDIETTRVPRNPLDVLAQQIVAVCALEERGVDEIFALVRRAYPFTDLSERVFNATLDMLAGRYPSDEFAELRPRIVWDRVSNKVRGRAGAQRLAVVNGGTIPDRGLYSANLVDDGKRVGELDEEMVYELRVGQTFVLGATTWRVAEITPSQVLVTPAPGEPGTVAFWKGDALGRPVELGVALGRLTRELRALPQKAAGARLDKAGLDASATRNLLQYLRDQADATDVVPDDRTIVIEQFRDQLGDWRVCVLTPFGARVHVPWALVAAAQVSQKLGVDVQSIQTDDGFALRIPELDVLPEVDDLLLDPGEVGSLVSAQLHGSPLFASRFRENAARALLLPRRRPGQRTPLWQQRQRSHDLLQVASHHPQFPILLETYRECLSDVFAIDALSELMRNIRSREVRVVRVRTEAPSPFARSLLFDYIAQYMYEGDAPLAERRAEALTLDREMLAELLGAEDIRELLDPEAMAALELELQGLLPQRFPRDVDEAEDALRRLGDLTDDEARARGVSATWLDELAADRRAFRLRVGGEERWITIDDAARYRDGLGASLPAGLPHALLPVSEDPLGSLVARWARTHVPFFAADLARRWGLPLDQAEQALAHVCATGKVLRGEFSPGRAGSEYCHIDVLRALRRRSLAALRHEIEPVSPRALARFLPAWQGVDGVAGGADRLLQVIQQLQGTALPASVIERDILPARVRGYAPAMLDELMAVGEVIWVGRAPMGQRDGKMALYVRSDAAALLSPPVEKSPGELQGLIRNHLQAHGASFYRDLHVACGGAQPDELVDALWDMVWAGEVTNDTLLPLRRLGPRARRATRRPLMRLGPPASEGRWSLVAGLLADAPPPTARAHAQTMSLLLRHGVLTREAALAEGLAGGFAGIYPVLRVMEEAGKIRRGYFVEGLGGAQFALPGAVDRLRSLRNEGNDVLALAATDPANPYGVTIPWPTRESRMARAAGAYVVMEGGGLRAYLERGGRSLLTVESVDARHLNALAVVARRAGKLEIQTVDGRPVAGSAIESTLKEIGFGLSPRGMVLWPAREPVHA
jgi:ATP-dependent Lhr-like helicase